MADYASEQIVTVRPYASWRDGDTVTIGDVERQVFLALPASALDLVESLAAGRTVGETTRAYEEKYHESPDMDDFLAALEAEGFVGDGPAPEAPAPDPLRRSWSLDGLTPSTARRLIGAPVMAVFAVVVVAGTAAQVDDITIMPTVRSLFFPEHFAILTWLTFFAALAGVTVHELAHVVAARAAGIPSRIGISNQLYILTATTDMSGIWLVPKRQRYLAFMIGSIVDLVAYSFLACVQWGGRNGFYPLPSWAQLLITGIMLTYSTRIVWQWFFFLRTDGYYVISTWLNCKNLLVDTQDYLRNTWYRLVRSPWRVDQSSVPRREFRIVRLYAVVWLAGRAVFILLLVTVGLPLLWYYVSQSALWVARADSDFTSWDFATVVVLSVLIDGGGIAMWLRSLRRAALARRGEKLVTTAPAEATGTAA